VTGEGEQPVAMNWEQMKKNVGCRVQLIPIACRVDEKGHELSPIDDDWIIDEVSTAGVRVSNVRTGHVTTLGKDHVHHFTSNPDRSRAGILYGFLTLNVQVFLQGNKVWVRPNARPGEPLKPRLDEVVEKWVDIKYPFDSGLQRRLEAAGYRVAWCLDTNLSRKIDLENWEIVVAPDAQGVPTKFRLKDRPADQTLIKRRNS
jgi:hypothetical protein